MEDVVAEVTELPQEGENWSKDFDVCSARAQFTLYKDPPLEEDKKQGTSRISLPLEFIQPTTFII